MKDHTIVRTYVGGAPWEAIYGPWTNKCEQCNREYRWPKREAGGAIPAEGSDWGPGYWDAERFCSSACEWVHHTGKPKPVKTLQQPQTVAGWIYDRMRRAF